MRHFQRLVQELKSLVSFHRIGDPLPLPTLMPTLLLHGRRLCYATMGMEHSSLAMSKPVVLLHGFGGFFMDWPRVMAAIARHTHVYALDLPGWGFSEPHLEAASMDDDVITVQSFIERMQLKDVILCGISYGAGVAWASASLGMKNVDQYVLLNPMPPHPIEHMHSTLYKSIFLFNSSKMAARIGHKVLPKSQFKLACKESLLHFRLMDSFYLDLGYRVIKQPKIADLLHAHARGAIKLNWDLHAQRLRDVEAKVTILQGRQDKIFSLESARYLQSLIPNADLLEVDACGHAMVFDQHKRVSDFIIGCLDKNQSGGASTGT